MCKSAPLFCALLLSLSARRAWIEMLNHYLANIELTLSLSARRAWIEIAWVQEFPELYKVALRKESVDRNHQVCQFTGPGWVALRKESVDRNYCGTSIGLTYDGSLSARRAWIEIGCWRDARRALGSLSARRAWIEIYNHRIHQKQEKKVALRKESVDRNNGRFRAIQDP